ncbi:hypothetical protein ACC785_34500, partial [Rhizobium ruizarguesonis]
LRFILWSSQMGQSLLQNGLFQRGKVKVESHVATTDFACGSRTPANYRFMKKAQRARPIIGSMTS